MPFYGWKEGKYAWKSFSKKSSTNVAKDRLKDLCTSKDNFASSKGRMPLETLINTRPQIRSQR